MLASIEFKNFTCFKSTKISLSSGINVFIGENGTGKTNVLKTLYASCDIIKSKKPFAQKIVDVFYPSQKQINRLAYRERVSLSASVKIQRKMETGVGNLSLVFSNHTTQWEKAKVTGLASWTKSPLKSVYIPVKEMMANAPGFLSLMELREIHFEEIYADILMRAFTPTLRGKREESRQKMLDILSQAISGKVIQKKDEFFLKNDQGELEFMLLAEGMRKLGLLWTLIQNGTLLSGSVLFWDEPESNLNPKMIHTVVEILLELQRQGVQIFLATHDYMVLKELDLQRQPTDNVCFHSLSIQKDTRDIAHHSSEEYSQISPNVILETFGELLQREIDKNFSTNTVQ